MNCETEYCSNRMISYPSLLKLGSLQSIQSKGPALNSNVKICALKTLNQEFCCYKNHVGECSKLSSKPGAKMAFNSKNRVKMTIMSQIHNLLWQGLLESYTIWSLISGSILVPRLLVQVRLEVPRPHAYTSIQRLHGYLNKNIIYAWHSLAMHCSM